MTAKELLERAALGKEICESDEQECERCPYVAEKDKQFHCMDHLFYDQRFIIDNRIGAKHSVTDRTFEYESASND